MTHHIRSIEKSREAALRRQTEGPFRLPKWVDLFGIDPDYLGGQSIDAYLAEARGEADPIDADHAVALERKRIAAWLGLAETQARYRSMLPQAIRAGAHWGQE